MIERASGEVLGAVEAERAFSTVHPGAVYLHLGVSYEVRELDVDRRRAVVERFDGDWYTQPKKETETFIEATLQTREAAGVELSFGTVSVTEQVIAFQRKRMVDHEVMDTVALELPEQNFLTQALWYVIPRRLAGALPTEILLGSLHATEHTQIAVLPLVAMCDRWDIGGLSTNVHFQTASPTIFIYDGHPRGIGIARRGYDEFERLVRDVAADRRVPVRGRLPLLHPEPEVRQPQRAAPQGGRARAHGPDAGLDIFAASSRANLRVISGRRNRRTGKCSIRSRTERSSRRGCRESRRSSRWGRWTVAGPASTCR